MFDKQEQLFLKEDIKRWGGVDPSILEILKLYYSKNGFKLMVNYRINNIIKNSVILKPFYLLWRLRYHHLCVKFGCDIPSHVKIAGGVKIIHTVGLTINSKVKIGKNFTAVGVGTLIGGTEKGVPQIGDNVVLGGNVTIVGNVKIGSNVEIGAGALVVQDIQDNAVVINEKSKILRIKEN